MKYQDNLHIIKEVKYLRSRVEKAIIEIKNNDGIIDLLQECFNPKERRRKLEELLPEIQGWNPVIINSLLFYIHYLFSIDLGVCEYFLGGDRNQYCQLTGNKQECVCCIPQTSCVLRGDIIPLFF